MANKELLPWSNLMYCISVVEVPPEKQGPDNVSRCYAVKNIETGITELRCVQLGDAFTYAYNTAATVGKVIEASSPLLRVAPKTIQ